MLFQCNDLITFFQQRFIHCRVFLYKHAETTKLLLQLQYLEIISHDLSVGLGVCRYGRLLKLV